MNLKQSIPKKLNQLKIEQQAMKANDLRDHKIIDEGVAVDRMNDKQLETLLKWYQIPKKYVG